MEPRKNGTGDSHPLGECVPPGSLRSLATFTSGFGSVLALGWDGTAFLHSVRCLDTRSKLSRQSSLNSQK